VEETDLRLSPGNGNPDPLLPGPESAMPTGSDAATLSTPRLCTIPGTPFLPASFSQERQTPVLLSRLLHGLATAFLILVFVSMPMFLLHGLRREIGNSLNRVGQGLKGNGDAQPDISSSGCTQIFNQNSISTRAVHNPIPGNSAKEPLDESGPGASTETNQRTVNSADSDLAHRYNSQHHFTDANVTGSRSALARNLWSTLGAGNGAAEIALLQL
jgi:hypothetical protein